MTPSRDELKIDFLNQHMLGAYNITPLQGDASLRKYDRITTKKYGNIILMDCPPTYCNVEPFINIALLLRVHDILTPNIIASDLTNGFLLLEDFGDVRVKDILTEDQEHNYAIYTRIIHILQKVQNIKPDKLEYHTDNVLIDGIKTFTEWYIPIALNKQVLYDNILLEKIRLESKERALKFLEIWKHLLTEVAISKNVVALRDFHVENLMHIDNKTIGVIDFQDAQISHPAYDLVSLLQDARWQVSDALARKLLLDYHSMNNHISYNELLNIYHVLGTQRNLRILGVFARKALRDKDYNYLKFIPRVCNYLRVSLECPILHIVKSETIDLLDFL
jgi:aminoglycoside/choline kinase family phosphotransferase